MIICISGYTGSGKTTLGDALAKKMGIKHVGISHKTQFVSNPSDTLEFTKRNTSASFEKSFDELVVEEAHKQDCVVTSWLSPWFIKDASVRVWLFAEFDKRVDRKMEELKDKGGVVQVRAYVNEKDTFNLSNWKKIYNIDINDHSIFDIEINTSKLSVDQCADVIALVAKEKGKNEKKTNK